MKITDEQNYCVELALKRKSFKINAAAGSGKTTVLEEIAKALGGFSYYLVFNREARLSAKDRFKKLNVCCHSNHSMAFATHGSAFNNAKKIAAHFNYNVLAQYNKLVAFPLAEGNILPASTMGYLGVKTIRKFCESASEEIGVEHAPLEEIKELWKKTSGQVDQFLIEDLVSSCVNVAKGIWPKMLDLKDPTPIMHDVYLKQWALSDPVIEADYILYDEIQDANPTIIGVLNKQKCPLFLVGDEHQQIYSWRGAVNAMRSFLPEAETASLTQSFRFGSSIAEVANVVLKNMCKSEMRLTGNPAVRSRLDVLGRPKAYLHRTNAGCLATISDLLASGVTKIYYDQAKSMIDLVQGIKDLKDFNSTRHHDLKGFRNYDDFMDYLSNNDAGELNSVVRVTKKFGETKVINTLQEISRIPPESAQVIISTGHKAKGKEWDSVCLDADFLGKKNEVLEGESANLLYVAVTRAKKELDINKILPLLGKTFEAEAPDNKTAPLVKLRKST